VFSGQKTSIHVDETWRHREVSDRLYINQVYKILEQCVLRKTYPGADIDVDRNHAVAISRVKLSRTNNFEWSYSQKKRFLAFDLQ